MGTSFIIFVIVTYFAIFALTIMYWNTRKHTKDNTNRLDILEISIQDVWKFIHDLNKHKKEDKAE